LVPVEPSIAPLRPGFVSVGSADGFVSPGTAQSGDLAIASADGRDWDSTALTPDCPSGQLVAGPAGLIVIGSAGDPHSPVETWCSSLDGRSWMRLPEYPPVGVAGGEVECRGQCAGGFLLGDGARIVAYRGYPGQAAWTSFDGRAWTRLALSGSRPTGGDWFWRQEAILTAIGLLFIDTEDGSTGFGAPET
jgi:hypothetical protein